MADNTIINANTTVGDTIASDDIGGVKYQRMKLTQGIDGTAIDVSSINPLPIIGALTDSQLRALAISTKEQPDSTATYCPNNSTSIAYEASRVVKPSAGVLYSICGYNSKAITQFIQIHNTDLLPIDTSIPVVVLTVPALSNFTYSSDKFGRFFSVGITVCNSLTAITKTIGGADIWFDIQYI